MDLILERCAGIDVHKKSVTVCVRLAKSDRSFEKHVKRFGTMTRQLLELSDWLATHGVTELALESTGVRWKPRCNILEGRFSIVLCNARKLKNAPGRKTDVKDSEWIAQLLQHGLLTGSYLPPRPQRDLRDLTRNRAQLTSEKTRQVNRIHKVLEDANIKLGVVASDIMGVSGRDMPRAIIAGESDPGRLAQLARRRMRSKIPELTLALEGAVSEHQRFLPKQHLDHVQDIEQCLNEHTMRIEALMACLEAGQPSAPDDPPRGAPDRSAGDIGGAISFSEAQATIVAIPGIDEYRAPAILAEIGADMSQSASDSNLCSWAKLCPGSHESAGRHKSVKTGKGNRWLRRILSPCAWGASRTKNSYFSAQDRRLARRRGKKRAIVAVSHSLPRTIHHLLKNKVKYTDLGVGDFDRLNAEQLVKHHKRRIASFDFTVTLTPKPAVA